MALVGLLPTISLHLTANCFSRRSELKQTLARVRIAAPVVCLNVRTPSWSSLLPARYIYSSDIADVDPLQLGELWAKTLELRRDPVKIMKSLKHSYAFVAVLTREEKAEGAQTKIVGIGRAISDGAFIATICDVAVDPAHQRRGIGRKIVRYLAKAVKKMDGPAGFAVFPPPLARRFFWMIGFREAFR
ncbi:serotonin N-acetyltransferase 2, chloroplastic isoform X2 [Cryptomeria japonica]|uniref:serotonin N-acetyltransferase 2, chloroplastic isoform X2 n=1 Tax=Cryptomeria japonica TaxID=3369 RepID=UPI0027D9F52D|nr:serotonin N-acetyltransferase 2, chloroplastic isoform X2 [Cryptomeria japonica]